MSTAHGDNSFDLLRVAAASLVIVFHSFALSDSTDPVRSLTGMTAGSVGVLAFFGISGYLVSGSWLGDPRPRIFAVKRGLRIVPGLMAAAVFAAFVVGPLMTTLSLRDYLTDATPYTYVARQLVFVTFNPELPGVFTDNQIPDVVNGSLWTIPLEVCCYLAVLVAGLLGLLRRAWVLAALLAVVVVTMAVAAPGDASPIPPEGVDIFLNGLRPCGAFLAGALIYVLGQRVPFTLPVAALVAALLFVPVSVRWHSAIDILAIPYLVVMIGSLQPGRLGRLTAHGDVSYGMYVYAYPLQQTLVDLAPGIAPGVLLAASLPAAWVMGWVSWRLVEHPALRLKRRLPDARSAAAPVPVPSGR